MSLPAGPATHGPRSLGMDAEEDVRVVKVEDAYDEEEAVRIAMANSLNDILPTKLEDVLSWSARDHERE